MHISIAPYCRNNRSKLGDKRFTKIKNITTVIILYSLVLQCYALHSEHL